MTLDDHLKLMIGDLVIRVAQLAAENDALKAREIPKGNGHDTTGTRGDEPQRVVSRE